VVVHTCKSDLSHSERCILAFVNLGLITSKLPDSTRENYEWLELGSTESADKAPFSIEKSVKCRGIYSCYSVSRSSKSLLINIMQSCICTLHHIMSVVFVVL
jgi:hypothetical protein